MSNYFTKEECKDIIKNTLNVMNQTKTDLGYYYGFSRNCISNFLGDRDSGASIMLSAFGIEKVTMYRFKGK